MADVQAPQDRNGFRVAIICALPVEADGVQSILDKNWGLEEQRTYGKAPGDPNSYTTGVIGQHNVVLVHLPNMGSNTAASVSASLRSSYQRIAIAFVTGICGVVPVNPQTEEEIILGDCIVSTTIFQYDLGSQYPSGFRRKNNPEDSLGRANSEIRSYLARLSTRRTRQHLITRLRYHLDRAQQDDAEFRRPKNVRDRLFASDYEHKHRQNPPNVCNKCIPDVGTCRQGCDILGCDEAFLITRSRLLTPETSLPRIHFGRYGSANTVMKSGTRRDKINAEDDIIAFEMEGSGVWDTLPTIVVKSACDYADSHKTKEWQLYAAITAAAGMKAMLEQWDVSEHAMASTLNNLTLDDRSAADSATRTPPALPPRASATPGAAHDPSQTPLSPPLAASSSGSDHIQRPPGASIGSSSQAQHTPRQSAFFEPPALSEEDREQQNQDLIRAAAKGDLELVKSLHLNGADLNCTNKIPYAASSPLYASATSWKQMMALQRNPFLSNISASASNVYRQTASMHWGVLNYLLNNGARWNALPVGELRNEVQRALYAQAQQAK